MALQKEIKPAMFKIIVKYKKNPNNENSVPLFKGRFTRLFLKY